MNLCCRESVANTSIFKCPWLPASEPSRWGGAPPQLQTWRAAPGRQGLLASIAPSPFNAENCNQTSVLTSAVYRGPAFFSVSDKLPFEYPDSRTTVSSLARPISPVAWHCCPPDACPGMPWTSHEPGEGPRGPVG